MSIPNRQWFLDYMRAFNAHDFDKQYSYYTDDVILDIPDPQTGTLRGKDGIKAHYMPLFGVCEEIVVPMVLAIEGKHIFYIMESYFKYTKKMEKGVFGYPVDVGDVVKIRVWAHYQVENGLMKEIVCNLFKSEFLPQGNLKELVLESQSRAQPDLCLPLV
ncbi:hypothetical protein Sste5346_003918 [Sporothrix stenoceras]|uniref:SnoaL-like domain-containing protein n=1 Tax=Sporothrix stenoceras TaxID=5173 RepID=A0ABR3ZBV8_9PEZI